MVYANSRCCVGGGLLGDYQNLMEYFCGREKSA